VKADEEREFHAQQSNGSHERPDSVGNAPAEQRAEAPREAREPAHESAPEQQREPQRESRNEGTQAPLDLPPPPPAKPFVVWSSGNPDGTDGRRDE
jgi:hypothetical protein